jgi:energy-coupling factor transporter ATP-binding protein EcfA2
MRDAARRLVQDGSLTEQDFTDLLSICMAEANGQEVVFSGLSAGALGVQDATKPLRLESIADVRGINALCPNRPLEFGNARLCIVYGRNGAGKSGYVRLLKHACGAKQPGELLTNIFRAGPQPQTAKFTFAEGSDAEDTQTKTSAWFGPPLPELRGVDIYDTACGLIYVNDESEVTFEPWLLRLFTHLTGVCEELSRRIQVQIQANVSKKPVFPQEYSLAAAATWYANLTAGTTTREVDDTTNWTPADEDELAEINKRLAETNPTARATALHRQKVTIGELLAALKNIHGGLSVEKCEDYLRAKADAKAKRTAADQDAKMVFENAPLAGIGSESWRLLWEAARAYSTEYAYTTEAFPNVAGGARCVLCQRTLDHESRDRLRTFEAFVKGELQRHAMEAEQFVQTAIGAFPDVPSAETLTLRMEAAGISDDNDRRIVLGFAAAIAKRKDTCLRASLIGELPAPPNRSSLVDLVRFARKLARQARSYERDAKNENRPLLEQTRNRLSARKWLNQQRKAIDAEIVRLSTIHELAEADRLTHTRALTTRKSELSEELITAAYIHRFEDELKRLKGASIPVILKKTRPQVGRVYHRICLDNANREDVRTSDILSEGEFRVVSLAAFIADTEGRGTKTPFIFDDPISSLDQVYEEAAAQRLVALSKNRQVIVFTHRLSLVGLLEKYADKESVDKTIVCLSRIKIGDIAELPITLTKTKATANRFLNERIKVAKAAFQAGDAEYEKEAKALCRDIRILLEQVVEIDLLAGVVRRYNPEVQTKGKIEHLAKITAEDCKFVDDMMTSYSRYEHSQPEEAPVELPRPDDIEKNLKEIASFIETIQKRNKQ